MGNTAQAALSSQIPSIGGVCGADVQGQDYKGCTAGEISISEVVNVIYEGGPITECVAGDPLTIQSATVNYSINTQERNDLIMWIGDQQGTDPRLSSGGGKTCSAWSLPDPFNPTPDAVNPFGDNDGDQCGDLAFSVDQASRTFTGISAECQDNDGDGKADYQILLTWSQNANQACGTGGGQSFPTVGSVSKCDFQVMNTVIDIVYPPILTLQKSVITDSGGSASATDWNLTATGPDSISGVTGTAAVTDQTVSAGAYTLGETGPSGYSASWNCTGAATNSGTSLTLANSLDPSPAARTTVCTVTNDDIPATLTLVKEVDNTNAGGNAVADDWDLTADGTGANDYTYTTTEWSGGISVGPDTFALSESGPTGYTASSWVCTGTGTQNNSSITLALGQSAVCTITNDDVAPTLTLIKSVSGGSLTSADFTLHVTGAGGGCGQDGTADYVDTTGTGVAVTPVESNCEYTISEDPEADYTLSSISCGAAGYPLTMNEGATVTCTVTNTYAPPGSITLVKDVTNDNGGQLQAANFPLQLTAADGCNAPAGDVSSGYVLSNPVDACIYTVSETEQTGYTNTGIVCQQGTNDPVGDSFTFAEGDTWTCTVSNDDISPTLTLVKTVTNDSGGQAGVDDWTLRAAGDTNYSGTTTGYWSGGVDVDAGDYTLSEINGPSGYTAGSWDCGDANGQLSGDVLTLNLADDVTCTIDNDDNEVTLMLIKDVTNDSGGNLQEDAFTITLTGDDSDTVAYPGTSDHSAGLDYTGTPDPGIAAKVFAGVEYTVSEDTLPDGYELTGISCVDTNGPTPLTNPFTPTLGQSIVCTVSNDDIQQNAFFRTTKDFSDDSTAAVQVMLKCNTGLPLEQTFTIWEGHSVNFVVHDFESGTMDCYIQEIGAGTDGYTSSYLAGAEDGQGTVRTEADGCYFDAVEGGQFTCDLTNELDPVSFTVHKNWLDVDANVDVQLHAAADYTCYNVRTAPDGNLQQISGGMDFDGIEDYDVVTDIYPAFDGSSFCVANESWLPSAAEGDDSDCDNVPLSVGEGGSCTIYNTVFFEGIPTLSQWGLAVLAVLTLGIGLVAFRRFV